MPADPLALAVTQLPGWRWLPGMRWLYRDQSGRGPYRIPKGAVPDLDDEATGGCLLGLLVAMWCRDDARFRVEVDALDGHVEVDLWYATDMRASYDAPTLARACAAALAAIGRCA